VYQVDAPPWLREVPAIDILRRGFQVSPSNAVVVRQGQGKDCGPGGKTVFLANALVGKPMRPFDDYDDCSLIENCCKDVQTAMRPGVCPAENSARCGYM
jgi:hypothetical protein